MDEGDSAPTNCQMGIVNMDEGDENLQGFRQSLVTAVQMSLRHVQSSGSSLPLPIRDQALHILSYAFQWQPAWGVAHQLLLAMLPKMEWMGHRADWLPYLETALQQARQLADEVADEVMVAEFHLQLGILHQLLSQYEPSIKHLNQSSLLFAALNQPAKQSQALNRMAYVACLRRQYDQAAELVASALTLLQGEPGEPDEPIALSYSYFLQGIIAEENDAFEQAVTCFQRALTYAQQSGDQRLIALRMGNFGPVLRRLARYEEAIAYYEGSIALFEQVQDFIQQAMMRMNLGNVYLSQQQPEKALHLYQLVEPILQTTQDQFHLALITTNMGIAYRDTQQFTQAESFLLASVERWQRLQNNYLLVNSLQELGLVYQQQGFAEQAQTTFTQAFQLALPLKDQPGYAVLLASLSLNLSEQSEVT